MVKPGDKAPEFEAEITGGKKISLSDYLGKKVVLYFYPRDMTPGCTNQACSLRDNYDEIKKKTVLFGISTDNLESHRKFTEKHNLPFPLIYDKDGKIAEKYGVKRIIGVKRTTFIIDEKGNISDVIEKVDTKNHAEQILQKI